MTRCAAIAAALVVVLCACSSPSPRSLADAGERAIERGDYPTAVARLEEARSLADAQPTPSDVKIRILRDLGEAYLNDFEGSREADAIEAYREALQLADASFGPEWNGRLDLLERLSNAYVINGQWADARVPLEEWIQAALPRFGPERTYGSIGAGNLLQVYSHLGETEKADSLRAYIENPRRARGDPHAAVATFSPDELFLRPGQRYLSYTQRDMPLRVAIGLPEIAALDATPEETQRAAIRGLREWELGIRRVLPWFDLEFSDADPDAQVQVRWMRRPRGYQPATGRIFTRSTGDEVRVSSSLTLSAQPVPSPGFHITPGQLTAYAIHAFGSALGLPDCSDCDSMMSTNWRGDQIWGVTELDLRTFEALVGQAQTPRDVALAVPEPGVLADLPFINTGDEREVVIDIAPEGQTSFVVTLDTGANITVLTRDYARALGVSVRKVKQDAYRRDTATGRAVRFYVSDQKSSAMEYALLGGEFIENFVVEIDFDRLRVRLLDPDLHEVGDDPAEIVVPLQMNERRPYAELALGTGSVWALVDTGAQAPLILTEEQARALGIEPDPEGERLLYYNVMGTSTDVAQTVPSARLGPVTLSEVALHISLRDESSARITRWLQHEAIVGIDILRDYRVRFDYPRARMGLVPRDRKGTEEGGVADRR
jgi:hypothetical protein